MAQPAEALDGVAEALCRGRGYSWIGMYLAVENLGVRQSSSGPASASATMADLHGEIAVPIKQGTRTLGLLVAETGRQASSARQDRALLQQVTKLIARYIITNRAQQRLRTTQEKLQSEPEIAQQQMEQPQKGPQSVRPAMRKAAAGGRITR
jgi:transcriptional regulator with GAF, ATPase, and Fis domain